MSGLVAGGFLITVGTAWWAAFRVIPAARLQSFRIELWDIREGAMLELLDGAYDDPTAARGFIKRVERLHEEAEHVHLIKFWIREKLGVGGSAAGARPMAWDRLSATDRVKLRHWQDRLEAEFVWHSLTGSFSGVIVLVLLVLTLAPVELFHALRRKTRDWLRDAAWVRPLTTAVSLAVVAAPGAALVALAYLFPRTVATSFLAGLVVALCVGEGPQDMRAQFRRLGVYRQVRDAIRREFKRGLAPAAAELHVVI